MYITRPLVSNASKRHTTITPSLPLDKPSQFFVDMSGEMGRLGGDNAISAMAAVHVCGSSRWLGWYNNPGPFQISARLGSFAKTKSWRIVFNGSQAFSKNIHMDPTSLFGLDSCEGPKFWAANSETVIEDTGYLASLFIKECVTRGSEGKLVPGRKMQPVRVTIVDLGEAPATEMHLAHSNLNAVTLLAASVPIIVSVGTCALCAICQDWYASVLILVGIIASGVSCLVLGSADLVFHHPGPTEGSTVGNGIFSSDKNIVLLRGTDGAVNSVTCGRFSLRFWSEGHYHLVQWCSFLHLIQAITQLLLISQALPFGRIMFLTSLGVSALYNAWLSSMNKERILRNLLFERILKNPTLTKYTLGTRATAVIFLLLVLRLQNPMELLNELFPKDTKVWKQWKATIAEWLRHPDDQSFRFGSQVRDPNGFTPQERGSLQILYDDAQTAYIGYRDYLRANLL